VGKDESYVNMWMRVYVYIRCSQGVRIVDTAIFWYFDVMVFVLVQFVVCRTNPLCLVLLMILMLLLPFLSVLLQWVLGVLFSNEMGYKGGV